MKYWENVGGSRTRMGTDQSRPLPEGGTHALSPLEFCLPSTTNVYRLSFHHPSSASSSPRLFQLTFQASFCPLSNAWLFRVFLPLFCACSTRVVNRWSTGRVLLLGLIFACPLSDLHCSPNRMREIVHIQTGQVRDTLIEGVYSL